MARREQSPLTRTWHAGAPEPVERAAPIAQITDPALREILKIRRRGLLAEAEEIRRRLGPDLDESDDEVA